MLKVFWNKLSKLVSKAWKEHNYNFAMYIAQLLFEQALQGEPPLKPYYDNALNPAGNQPEQSRLL